MVALSRNNELADRNGSPLMQAHTQMRRWKRWMTVLGIALLVSVVSVIPFLEGYFLHRYFEAVGKYLIYASMCLLTLFVGAAALTYNFWLYWRNLKREAPGEGLRSD